MIRITFDQKVSGTESVIVGFSVEDHAGYAESGEDIVCSAVSALVFNTINSIEAFTSDKMEAKADPEKALVIVKMKEFGKESQLLLKSLCFGLQNLESTAEYEPYLDLIIREV